jgi:hypothetical protein
MATKKSAARVKVAGTRPPRYSKGAEERAAKRAAARKVKSAQYAAWKKASKDKHPLEKARKAKIAELQAVVPAAAPPPPKPKVYTPELGAAVCEAIEQGLNLYDFDTIPDMPGMWTIINWLRINEEFKALYYGARKRSTEALEAEVRRIADDGRNDSYIDDKGRRVTDWDVLGRSKLRVETLRWILKIRNPRHYGDRSAMEHTGAGGGPIQTMEVDPEVIARLTDEELTAYVAATKKMLGEGGGADA